VEIIFFTRGNFFSTAGNFTPLIFVGNFKVLGYDKQDYKTIPFNSFSLTHADFQSVIVKILFVFRRIKLNLLQFIRYVCQQ